MKLISCFLFCSIILIVCAQRISHEKCTNGFKYIYVNSKLNWVGLGWAWTTQGFRRHNITMDVNFATTALPDTSFLGSLKIIRFHLLKQLADEKQWNIIYEVIFPIQNPLPQVTLVVLNGDTLCDDTGE